MKNTILLFGILGMFSFPSAAQVSSVPVLGKTIKPKSAISQVPASLYKGSKFPGLTSAANIPTPASSLVTTNVASKVALNSTGKTSTWCLSDEVTNNYQQQQLALNPNYSIQLNKISQQVQQWLANNPNYLLQKAVKTIPVVVHVVYNTPDENVSNALIYDMINTLNEDFRRLNSDASQTRAIFTPVAADAQIEFCLAQRDPQNNTTTGIVRKTTTKTFFDPDTETDDMKKVSTLGDDAWDPYNYLNIWICDIDNGAGFGTAGYAYLPTAGMHGSWRDGLVVDNNIGLCYGCRTATHEIGHYFGLKHTWGNNPPSCSDDDGFTDTPTSSDENFGCNYSQNTCSNDVPNMLDQIENYMSYADCQNMYTTMQANYMNSVLNTTRSSLLTSAACNPIAPPVADFVADKTTISAGQYVQFTDLSTGGANGWSWDFGGGGTPNTSTFQNPLIQFSTLGTYTVTLTATNSLGSDGEIKNSYINVLADTTSCDTINWAFLIDTPLYTYTCGAGCGYVLGTNQYDDQAKAQFFTVSEFSPNTHVTGGLFYFATAYKSGSSNGKVVFTVWDDNGAGGSPNTVLATDTVDLATIVSDVQGGYLTQSLFIPPVAVSGNFYYGFQMVTFDLWAGGTRDSLTSVSPLSGVTPPSGNVAWEYSDLGAGFQWNDIPTAWGGNIMPFITPYMTDLPPTASFIADTVEGCGTLIVNFDASASQNGVEYYWDIDGDDTLDYLTITPDISIQYNTPGTYGVSLWVTGSCDGLDTAKRTNYITVNAIPSLTTTSSNSACLSCNGSANVTATVGTSPYTYSWNDAGSQTNSNATGLCAGSYQVLVKDANNCSANSGATVSDGANVLLSISSNDATCGLNNGSSTASPSGGTAPYTYSWTGGQTNSIAINLAPGTYHVTVTDINGCTVQTDFFNAAVISSVPFINDATASAINALCYGGNGTVSVTATTGITPYTYTWSSGCTTSLCNLVAGTYYVTVTDNNGCTDSATAIITQPATAVVASISSKTDVLCFGGSNGLATASGSGGTGAYTYNWSNGPTTSVNTGLISGNYYVTVRDNNSCSDSATAIITQPAIALSASTTQTNVLCFGNSTGQATATPAGGTGTYTYLWNDPAPVQSTATVTGLTAATWTVTITDNNGCSVTNSVTITEPVAVVSATTTQTNVLCFGNSTGQATATPAGGTGTYTYLWNDPAPAQSAATVTGLTAATWTVTITDNNGCSITNSVTITEPVSAITAATTQTNVLCFGGSNGSATASGSGGTGAYTYNWSNSPTTSVNTGLISGNYYVTVTDNNGCFDSATASITQPAALTLSVSTTDAACIINNGTATATTGGGVTPYTYLWSVSTGSQTTSIATGLALGSHSVSVTDFNNCLISDAGVVSNPAAPTIIISSQIDVTCFGLSNGSATASGSGGSGTLSYLWSASAGSQTTTTATGLSFGTYSVSVSDTAGCTTFTSASITQPNELTSIAVATNVKCNGDADGAVDLTVSGGSTPFTYYWVRLSDSAVVSIFEDLNNVPAETYGVLIIDSKGCQDSNFAIVTEPVALSGSIAKTDVTCNSGNDGTATVTVSGGTGTYTYNWSGGGQTTSAISGLSALTYSVTTTDSNACTIVKSAIVGEPTAVLVSASVSSGITCNNGSNGEAIASASDGNGAPYTYNWSNLQTGSVATGLSALTYSVTATDMSGCTGANSITITEPAAVGISVTAVDVTCNGGSNGSATAIGSGGDGGPYSHVWSDMQVGSIATGLVANTYSVTTSDASGCTTTGSVTVIEPAALAVTVDTVNATCGSCADGSASIGTASGGVVPYSYSWSMGGNSTTIDSLVPGNYDVTTTDSNSCTVVTAFVISFTQGIIEVNVHDQIDIFPNPSGGIFTINFNDAMLSGRSVKITNVIGQTVLEKPVQPGTVKLAFDLGKERDGLYFIQVFTNDGVVMKKITLVR